MKSRGRTPVQSLLRVYARRRKMSLHTIAKEAGCSDAAVEFIFYGRPTPYGRRDFMGLAASRKKGTRPLLFRMADVMGIPVGELWRAVLGTQRQQTRAVFDLWTYQPEELTG